MDVSQSHGLQLLWRSGNSETVPCWLTPTLALQVRSRRPMQVNWFVATFHGLPPGKSAEVVLMRTQCPAVGGRRVLSEQCEGARSLVSLSENFSPWQTEPNFSGEAVHMERAHAPDNMDPSDTPFVSWAGVKYNLELLPGWALQFLVRAEEECRVQIKVGGR